MAIVQLLSVVADTFLKLGYPSIASSNGLFVLSDGIVSVSDGSLKVINLMGIPFYHVTDGSLQDLHGSINRHYFFHLFKILISTAFVHFKGIFAQVWLFLLIFEFAKTLFYIMA